MLFSASQDMKIKVAFEALQIPLMIGQVWDASSYTEVASLDQHEASVQSLLVADNVLFSASDDKEIRVCIACRRS